MSSLEPIGPSDSIRFNSIRFNPFQFDSVQSIRFNPFESIHFELFHVPGQASSVSGKKETSISDDQPRSKIELTLDGRTIHFELAAKGLSILDAALQQGADLPYACKGGVCCSCRAKVTNGSVQMDVNYALEPEEVEAGYILTCQSHPTSENVVVNFDLK